MLAGHCTSGYVLCFDAFGSPARSSSGCPSGWAGSCCLAFRVESCRKQGPISGVLKEAQFQEIASRVLTVMPFPVNAAFRASNPCHKQDRFPMRFLTRRGIVEDSPHELSNTSFVPDVSSAALPTSYLCQKPALANTAHHTPADLNPISEQH